MPTPRLYLTTAILAVSLEASSQVAITEIQRDPAGAETASPGGASHEFIEITNLGLDTLVLDSLFISDGAEADAVVPWPSTLPIHGDCPVARRTLLPGETGLVLDRDYPAAVAKAPSSRLPIAAGCVLFTTDDADLGSGLANDDGVLLYKGTMTRVDTVLWCASDTPWGGDNPCPGTLTLSRPRAVPEGVSIVPASFLFDAVAYAPCSESMTPGRFELLKNGWFAEYRLGALDTARRTFACSLGCLKSATLPAVPVLWSVSLRSAARVSTASQGPLTFEKNRGSAVCALPLDSLSYSLEIRENGATTVWPLDVSALWLPSSPVLISELFPRATAGEPEWFELVNVSEMGVNLKNWLFGNGEGADTLARSDCTIAPGACLVVAANASLFTARYPAKMRVLVPPRWHSLDNYNDTLRLWDAAGHGRERVCWSGSWFADWKYQSLERVSLSGAGDRREAWVVAQSPTPGQPNGSSSWRAGSRPALDIGPIPFTPNNDGRDDLLLITIDLPAGRSATVRVYGFSGKKLREFSGPIAHRFFWDGRQDNGSPAPVGPFFVVMETYGPQGNDVIRKKGIVWR